jgi:hypothetical protein
LCGRIVHARPKSTILGESKSRFDCERDIDGAFDVPMACLDLSGRADAYASLLNSPSLDEDIGATLKNPARRLAKLWWHSEKELGALHA